MSAAGRILLLSLCLVLPACTGPTARGVLTGLGPVTADAALGDPRTVDFCSLLDLPRVLGGGAVTSPPRTSFTNCSARATDGPTKLVFLVGPLARKAEARLEPRPYSGALPPGATVGVSDVNPAPGCNRSLVLADGTSLPVRVADVSEGPVRRPESRCATAELMLATVVTAIMNKQVRHVTFADGSYGRLDPCPLLAGPALEPQAGPGSTPMPDGTGHGCNRGMIRLSFTTGRGGDAETIAGRPAGVLDGGLLCDVLIGRSAVDELADVSGIDVNQPGGTACAVARAAARVIIPQLPA
jgi:hypothetical protein